MAAPSPTTNPNLRGGVSPEARAFQAQQAQRSAEGLRAAAGDAVGAARAAAPQAVPPAPGGPPSLLRRVSTRVGRAAGKATRFGMRTLPAMAYAAPVAGFGDYKVRDDDTSVGGQLRRQAVEAGPDTLSGLAKSADWCCFAHSAAIRRSILH